MSTFLQAAQPLCHQCQSSDAWKNGKQKNGLQAYKCKACKTVFTKESRQGFKKRRRCRNFDSFRIRYKRLYSIWDLMIKRCYDPSYGNWIRYGGRGIKVCDRWLNSFEAFVSDMGDRPSPEYSLDRTDNNADYTPENCRWATAKEQGRNKRNNRLITINGETKCLSEWAESFGISASVVYQRLRSGWDFQTALKAPVQTLFSSIGRKKPRRLLTFKGETKTIAEWSRHTGISRPTLQARIDKGWTAEKALTEPINQSKRRYG
ncbi:hypothetical protein H6F86_21050 [Phormidium sp. FACHB-592]|uniref:HNH endonuclease n=1 Tax=Stenomitos frigidus AS-A4 TaxID=2933935 RepID=A0ABV0KER7_9CYAN|nr:hypothetical protein [Phormidium sp. FACHB-592]MBD2076323.1 hypothetical protein [Phormidium sp. FACHB-592]